jgi:glutamine synthetase
MSNATEVVKKIKDEDIPFVDLRFTDPRGKLQHLTMVAGEMGEDAFADGVPFDGSSIAGWKAINESDMTLMPDPETAHLDPFFAQSTLAIFCDVMSAIRAAPPARPRLICSRPE